MSRSDIIAVVYSKLTGELEGMYDWFTKHFLKNCHKSIYWLIHTCIHLHIYSNILSFKKFRLMKTPTNADGSLSQLKVVTWKYSWLFLTASSLWASGVVRKPLSRVECCQGGRIFADVEVVGIMWRNGVFGTRLYRRQIWKSLEYFSYAYASN